MTFCNYYSGAQLKSAKGFSCCLWTTPAMPSSPWIVSMTQADLVSKRKGFSLKMKIARDYTMWQWGNARKQEMSAPKELRSQKKRNLVSS